MSEQVGAIHYTVSLELAEFISAQRDLESRVGKMEQSFNPATAAVNKITQAIQALAAAMAVMKVVELADEFRQLEAKVRIAAGSVDAGAEAMARLKTISATTQTSLEGNVSTFARLNAVMLQMGKTQGDTLNVTELLAKAIKVSGGSAQETSAALMQFGQALGSGKLAGDEFRSMMENAPYLMKQLANAIGVPIGALKQMSADGKLTSEVLVDSLTKAAQQIDADFQQMPKTFSGAMQVLKDKSMEAAKALDDAAGSSRGLMGVTGGLTDVVEQLTVQLNSASGAADGLAKNNGVTDWANTSRVAISYLIDAADIVRQTLVVLGRNAGYMVGAVQAEIQGIGTQFSLVMQGKFSEAIEMGRIMRSQAEAARKELDEADAKTMASTAGARMRQAWSAPQADYSNEGRATSSGGGTPKTTPNTNGTPKSGGAAKGPTFDSEGYLAGLEQATLQGADLIAAREAEELRRNDQKLATKAIQEETHEQAKLLIAQKYQAQRDALAQQEADKAQRLADAGLERANKASQQKIAAEQALQQAIDAIKYRGMTPEGKAIADAEAEIAALDLKNQGVLGKEQELAEAKLLIAEELKNKLDALGAAREDADRQTMSMQLQGASQGFAAMANIIGTFAGKQSAAYKAMFAVSKAFAIADLTVSINTGLGKALKAGWPQAIPLWAATAAQGAALMSALSGANYGGGRAYGGPVDGGKLYQVNETGAPEMFTSATGKQYMLPNKAGSITPADKLSSGQRGGGAVPPNLNLSMHVQGVQMPDGWLAIQPDEFAAQLKKAYRDGWI